MVRTRWLALLSAPCLACVAAPAAPPRNAGVQVTPPPSAYPAADPPWRAGDQFHVWIEQDGVAIPVRDHRISVARRSFTLVLALGGVDTIDVSASLSPKALERARRKDVIVDGDDENPFGVGRGITGEPSNPPRELYVGQGYDEWGWMERPSPHGFGKLQRCHAHERPPGAPYFVCKRVVEVLRAGADDVTPIERTTARELYVVLLAGEWSGRGGAAPTLELRELQREWVTIAFR